MKITTIENHFANISVVPEKTIKVVFLSQTLKDRIRVWVLQNAFTLIFLAIMFIVTWVLLLMLLLNKS